MFVHQIGVCFSMCSDYALSDHFDLGAGISMGGKAHIATGRKGDPCSLICSQLGIELTVLKGVCPLYDIVTGNKRAPPPPPSQGNIANKKYIDMFFSLSTKMLSFCFFMNFV